MLGVAITALGAPSAWNPDFLGAADQVANNILLLGGGFALSDVSNGDLADALNALGGDIDDGKHLKPAARAGLGLDFYISQNIVLNAQASIVATTLKSPDIGDVDDLNYMSFAAGLQYRF